MYLDCKFLNATECRLDGNDILNFVSGHYHFDQSAKTFDTKIAF